MARGRDKVRGRLRGEPEEGRGVGFSVKGRTEWLGCSDEGLGEEGRSVRERRSR